jgi:glutaminase
MDYQKILEEIYAEVKPLIGSGKQANYIPELNHVDINKFGICLTTINGETYNVGDAEENFSIQSISKVITLAIVLAFQEKKMSKRVGVEPTGNAFNSLVQLEFENGVPRNPFINAGALVISDIILSNIPNAKQVYLDFIENKLGVKNLLVNQSVAQSEMEAGYLNTALANFLKSFGNLNNSVEEVLDFYYYQCAIEMSCKDLSEAFLLFANHGKTINNPQQVLSKSQTKRLNALMQTCGFYDEAGEFTFKVGLPGKSGVGGGIVAVCPQQYSIAVWAPGLNNKGNSLIGMKALELFTTKTDSSIF